MGYISDAKGKYTPCKPIMPGKYAQQRLPSQKVGSMAKPPSHDEILNYSFQGTQ